MARTKQRTKQRRRLQFRIPTAKVIRAALNRVSKQTLVQCFMILFTAAPKKVKMRVLIKLEKAPKKSRGKTAKRKTKRKSRRRVDKRRTGKKKSKAQIRAQRIRNLKKARAAKKRKR